MTKTQMKRAAFLQPSGELVRSFPHLITQIKPFSGCSSGDIFPGLFWCTSSDRFIASLLGDLSSLFVKRSIVVLP